MSTPNGNLSGTNKTTLWVTGAILIPIVLATFGNIFHTVFSTSERVTRLENEMKHIAASLDEIKNNIARLLDRKN